MQTTCRFSFRPALGALLACCAALAGAQALPTVREGVAGKELTTIKLPADFNAGNGRTLRMREVRIAPGGFLPMHSHAERPSVSYVLQGVLTEYTEGEPEGRQVTAGQSYASHGPKGHALRNKGEVPVVILEVDLS